MVYRGNALQGKGAYGIGVAKEVNDAIFKAIRFAILGAINIPLYRGHTVYYPSKTKFIRTKISIFPRPSDFGISASPIIMQACELLGIRDITVKVWCMQPTPPQFSSALVLHLHRAMWERSWLGLESPGRCTH